MTEVDESYTLGCDAVDCLAHETIKNIAAAAAAFDGGPDWLPDPSWFPVDWRAVRVVLNDAVKRIYGKARLSEIVSAGDSTGDSFWTFTLCPTHKDADPVIRDMRVVRGDDT